MPKKTLASFKKTEVSAINYVGLIPNAFTTNSLKISRPDFDCTISIFKLEGFTDSFGKPSLISRAIPDKTPANYLLQLLIQDPDQIFLAKHSFI